MLKSDLINQLAGVHGCSSYLELCTPTTGKQFSLIRSQPLKTRHRLVYNCPERLDDGLEYTYRTASPFSHDLVRVLHTTLGPHQYDMVFVDPHHTYDCTATDLYGAWCLLRPGGIMVVHDCVPPDENYASPAYVEGNWCGVTYQAYIDFGFAHADAQRYTVDCDYGCGVIFKPRSIEPVEPLARRELLAFEWSIARGDDADRYGYFVRRRDALLNLISVDDFYRTEGLTPPKVEAAAPPPLPAPKPEEPDAIAAQ